MVQACSRDLSRSTLVATRQLNGHNQRPLKEQPYGDRGLLESLLTRFQLTVSSTMTWALRRGAALTSPLSHSSQTSPWLQRERGLEQVVNLGLSTARIKCIKRSAATTFQHRLLSTRGLILLVVQSPPATTAIVGPSTSSLMSRSTLERQVHLS